MYSSLWELVNAHGTSTHFFAGMDPERTSDFIRLNIQSKMFKLEEYKAYAIDTSTELNY